jgi:quercetin dioxygenase-like cupin family protein
MPVKINEATNNRPEGNRIIDAPAVSIDLQQFTTQLKEETAWKKNDRNAITVFKTNGVTMVLTALHKGAAMDDLMVEGVFVLQVMEGTINIETDKEGMKLKEKQMLILHPGSKQNVTAEEDSILLLSNIIVAQ